MTCVYAVSRRSLTCIHEPELGTRGCGASLDETISPFMICVWHLTCYVRLLQIRPMWSKAYPYQSPRSDRKSRPATLPLIPACPSHFELELQIRTLQHPWLSSCSNISYSNPSVVSSSPSFDSHQTNATPFYPPSLLVSSSVSPLAKVNSPSIRSPPVVRFFP